MKIYSLIALLPILLLSATSTSDEIVIPKQVIKQQATISQGKLTPRELVRVKGKQYNVSVALMERIIDCESSWVVNAQSKHVYTKDRPREGVKKGQREQSYGLVMIHLPAHPNITKAQAINPEFAIDFLAKNLALGKGAMWTCYPKPMKTISL